MEALICRSDKDKKRIIISIGKIVNCHGYHILPKSEFADPLYIIRFNRDTHIHQAGKRPDMHTYQTLLYWDTFLGQPNKKRF